MQLDNVCNTAATGPAFVNKEQKVDRPACSLFPAAFGHVRQNNRMTNSLQKRQEALIS
jgi:hypothetical protein